MELKRKQRENEWLALLEIALQQNAPVKANHRFKFNNKNLGTFLVSAKRKPNIELIKKIESLGFVYNEQSKSPDEYLKKYISELSSDSNPNKQNYTNRFNLYVFPKKNFLKKETIKELNQVWKIKFNEIKKWEKSEKKPKDFVEEWKEFRYNKELNPDGKWFHYRKFMGTLYGWVYNRKRDAQKMKMIKEYFTSNELKELKKEGFLF